MCTFAGKEYFSFVCLSCGQTSVCVCMRLSHHNCRLRQNGISAGRVSCMMGALLSQSWQNYTDYI